MADDFERLRQVDWLGKSEPTLCSQFIMPILFRLGYGEHTSHPIREQASYKLKDPSYNRGHRRVQLDYLPTIYEKGLWVMEAKGSDEPVTPSTLGQVRDYAIHPEVRAALMVTVDAAGWCVFDPWETHWDEPILAIPLNEVVDRFDELQALLGVDRVAEAVRRRHLGHLERAMSASLEFGVLEDATREFNTTIQTAKAAIEQRRQEKRAEYERQAKDRHQRVLRSAGVYGVIQHFNTSWALNRASALEFRDAVLLHEPRQRPTQIKSFRRAIEAIYKSRGVASGDDYLYRPLWWVHIVVLGGSIAVRDEEGCEPAATEVARAAITDCILGFPDDPLAAAAWRYQRAVTPLVFKIAALGPLDQISREALPKLSAEFKLEFPDAYGPDWLFETWVKMTMIKLLEAVDPWTVERLDELAEEALAMNLPSPPRLDHLGPGGDPGLDSWRKTDPLLLCALHALSWNDRADDLVAENPGVLDMIKAVRGGEDLRMREAAAPLADRLNLTQPLFAGIALAAREPASGDVRLA